MEPKGEVRGGALPSGPGPLRTAADAATVFAMTPKIGTSFRTLIFAALLFGTTSGCDGYRSAPDQAFHLEAIPGGPLLTHSIKPDPAEILGDRLRAHGFEFHSWSFVSGGGFSQATYGFESVPTAEQVNALIADLEIRGELQFLIVAEGADLMAPDLDLAAEQARMSAWIEVPNQHLVAYNTMPADEGGSAQLLWFREPTGPDGGKQHLVPCLRSSLYAQATWAFATPDVARTFATTDEGGHPAFGVEFVASRSAAFAEFTGAYAGHRMAFVLDGELLSTATIEHMLSGAVTVGGRFSDEDVERIVRAIETPLPFAVRYLGER